MPLKPELMVVMPVYNEQASVRKVVIEWFNEIENWTEDFIFYAVNDGSTDDTPRILSRLRGQLGPRFEIRQQSNVGHGQSCLLGYREACNRGIPYVVQIDSDGQCDPQYFFRFWRNRGVFDVIYGQRVKREDGWRRVAASYILRANLLLAARTNCVDANVPYRLMSTARLDAVLDKIPRQFSLANVALAVLLKHDKTLRHGRVKIKFRERYGGEPSVALGKFGAKAFELNRQLRQLSKVSHSQIA
jgi:glycosyltransferase involved in cell wall biosynthesis